MQHYSLRQDGAHPALHLYIYAGAYVRALMADSFETWNQLVYAASRQKCCEPSLGEKREILSSDADVAFMAI